MTARVGPKPLAGKVALVTGGSRGIGRAIVMRFAASGASVAFTYRQAVESADEVVDTIVAAAGRALAIQADARDFTKAGEVVAQVNETFGLVDVLVNNAASAHYGRFEDMSEQDWDDTVAGTLKVAFNYTRHVLPLMRQRGGGSIINISSINGIRGREGSSAYGAGKAGMNGLTRTLAREVGSNRIRVNAIAPGFVATESQKGTPEIIKKLVRDECALPDFTSPEDIANAALYLASDGAKQVTGHVLQVDAGQWV